MAQFKEATLKVYHLDESMAMLALKQGLRSSCITYSWDKTPMKSYSKMLARMQKYIYEGEGALSRSEADGELSKKKAKEEPSEALSGKPNLSH